ncbi:MAG: 2-hydroxyacyl-CoA dehydratase [Deltaproteobacteria bacterium]|nr:2-hydroxyacyl-CoA dehydratase [Deltaproteobacteria bacterium]
MNTTGLARAGEIARARTSRALALKAAGRKIVGYLSLHVPLELVEALGMVPFRLSGDIREPVTQADRGLPAAFCPYMRSVLDLSLKGRFGFLDGFAQAHPCDAQEKTVRVISSLVPFRFAHFVDVPATVHGYAVEYFAGQLRDFRRELERFAGRAAAEDELYAAIDAYNEQRALVRELYDLKKTDPPALSGRETLDLILAVRSLPAVEGNALLRESILEVRARPAGSGGRRPRLLVWGSVVDDWAYLDLIEACGADVVIDDLDEGTRPFQRDVNPDGDPMQALAVRYLAGVPTARTFLDHGQGERKKDNLTDLDARYRHLRRYIEEWRVDGVLLQSVRYCDPHGYELVDVMDYLRHLGVPAVYVEHNYSEGALAPLRTRVEAFVETLG